MNRFPFSNTPDISEAPPFHMTNEITNLVIEIAELTGEITISEQKSDHLKLRRENRIKSIQSSLAIEQNSLTIEQVSDIVNGKRVLGPPQDIREARNAYEAYELLTQFNSYSVRDLLKAHKVMMADLVKEAGLFRSAGVGVYVGEQLIHAGSPPQYVPQLIRQLFECLKSSKLHPLIKGCIFHYEFEFIHPFADGNGRVGRLWHTLILAKWKEFYLWTPIESMIFDRQQDYYRALNAANTAGESTIFVEFMLGLIKALLEDLAGNQLKASRSVEERIILMLKENGRRSVNQIARDLGLSVRQTERIMKQLRESGWIEHQGANRNGFYIVKQK